MAGNRNSNRIILLPTAGALLFILLYFFATTLYPGGSEHDRMSKGFSWQHNYWCNLLNEKSLDGLVNNARPVAIIALFVLCAAVAIFFYLLPQHQETNKRTKILLQYCGVGSMLIMPLLLVADHDTVINIAGGFGLVALLLSQVILWRKKYYRLFYFGVFNLVLMGVNNYIFHTGNFFNYLSIIQKITFLSFILWMIMVNLYVIKKVPRD